MPGRLALPIFVLLALCHAASALDLDDAHWCRNGLFPSDKQTIILARISKTENLYRDSGQKSGCPAERAACRDGSVLKVEQTVLAGKSYRNFVCVYHPASGSAGWIPRKAVVALTKQTIHPAALSEWAGDWRDGDNSITIAVSRDGLHTTGGAYWHGFGGNVHEGSFDADARPSNNRVAFAEEGCHVQVHLVGTYLVVSDNAQCGGMNVRFDGVYQRAARKRK